MTNSEIGSHFLSQDDFATVIRSTPLVSIDFIIARPDGTILLGKRHNEPARGSWFVPGGRIRKNERLDAAFQRLLAAETGLSLSRASAAPMGVYEHLYDTNALGDPAFGTHYVVIAYRLDIPDGAVPVVDSQHAEFRWQLPADLLDDPHVHANTKAYFAPEAGAS
jgi:colanic acid biosynthesis protein WcaH